MQPTHEQIEQHLTSKGFRELPLDRLSIYKGVNGEMIVLNTDGVNTHIFVPCLLEGDNLCIPAHITSLEDVDEAIRGF